MGDTEETICATGAASSGPAGAARTSVVVNVAASSEHAAETVCSLDFGLRMARVRSTATIVVGTDAAAERASVTSRLEAARSAVARLTDAGGGERFGVAADETSVRAFRDNVARIEEEEGKARRAKVAEYKVISIK